MTRTLRSIFLSAILLAGGMALAQTALAQCSGGACPLRPSSSMKYLQGLGGVIPNTGGGTALNSSHPTAMGVMRPALTASGADPSVSVGSVAPYSIMLPNQVLTIGQFGATAEAVRLPAFNITTMLFEVRFTHAGEFPDGTVTFGADVGIPSTLPDTLTVCPGVTLPLTGNPACDSPAFITSTTPNGGDVPTNFSGLMRYTKTANRFGGVAADTRSVNGGAGWANYAGIPASGLVGTALVPALRLPLVVELPFGPGIGFVARTHVQDNRQFVFADVTTAGLVNFSTPDTAMGTAPGLALPQLNGPWTTGRVTLSETGLPAQIHMIEGTDTRTAAGNGIVSMVSGKLIDRGGATSTAIDRGFVTLALPEPGMALGALAGVGLLGVLARRQHLTRPRSGADSTPITHT